MGRLEQEPVQDMAVQFPLLGSSFDAVSLLAISSNSNPCQVGLFWDLLKSQALKDPSYEHLSEASKDLDPKPYIKP